MLGTVSIFKILAKGVRSGKFFGHLVSGRAYICEKFGINLVVFLFDNLTDNGSFQFFISFALYNLRITLDTLLILWDCIEAKEVQSKIHLKIEVRSTDKYREIVTDTIEIG